MVGITSTMPVIGVQMLLGNDLAGSKVVTDPILSDKPGTDGDQVLELLQNEIPGLFPACVVTRSMAKEGKTERDHDRLSLEGTFMMNCDSLFQKGSDVKLTRTELIRAQSEDPELSGLVDNALTQEESENVPNCFFMQSGFLVRKWRDPEVPANHEWEVRYQVVIPTNFREYVLQLAHETPMAGHLGIKKTLTKLLEHFWWPGVRKSVVEHCRCCHVCQVVGKPNQGPVKAPLKPIPAFREPFSRVIVDCVGPLPRTSAGNEYLLTIMCASTRFPEAIPLRNIRSQTIVKALLKFFTQYGLPKSVQTDQGSNFMSGVFTQVMKELGITHHTSSAYHPESQGALERYHQTLKNMKKTGILEFLLFFLPPVTVCRSPWDSVRLSWYLVIRSEVHSNL